MTAASRLGLDRQIKEKNSHSSVCSKTGSCTAVAAVPHSSPELQVLTPDDINLNMRLDSQIAHLPNASKVFDAAPVGSRRLRAILAPRISLEKLEDSGEIGHLRTLLFLYRTVGQLPSAGCGPAL